MDILTKLEAGIITTTAEETETLAKTLASALPENHTLALKGDLGAGKTTFVRGLARAWEIEEPITSPTFNLFNTYKGTRNLIHLDAYRLNNEAEGDSLMLEEFLEPPFCLAIEWPEKFNPYWMKNAWELQLTIVEGDKHRIQLTRP